MADAITLEKESCPILTVDLGALEKNYRILARRARGLCAPVVKADAYGIGLDYVVPTLTSAGAGIFFTSRSCEAVRLRSLSPQSVIYVLDSVTRGTLEECASIDARPVLNSWHDVLAWGDICQERDAPLPAALQVDTGMSRLGLTPDEIKKIIDAPSSYIRFEPCLLLSHLVNAEDPAALDNHSQIVLFESILSTVRTVFPKIKGSLDNSSGLFLPIPHKSDIARVGYALYGGNPTPCRDNPMHSVIKLHAPVIQLRSLSAGRSIGYGGQWTAPDTRIVAILSIGYGDGYPRAAAWINGRPGGMVVLAGVHCPIIGHISMDLMAVDVTAVPDGILVPGFMAEIIGETVCLGDIAGWAGTIGYEILTRLTQSRARCKTLIIHPEGHSGE